MVSPREALARLQSAADDGRLDEVARRRGLSVLVTFGSATHPEVEDPRDLDLALGFLPGTARDLLAVWGELAELSGVGDRLDLLDLDVAGPVARAQGLVGTPLFEATPRLYGQRQIAALLDYMDTAWLRRIELERLASR